MFRLPLLTEPRPPGPHSPRPCPVCGQGWQPWPGSYLPCHGRCLPTEEAQDALLDEQGVTEAEQARRLGVSVAVVRSSIFAARRRRARRSAP